MTSWPGQQTITIHILPNILQNKDNQKIKLGKLIKYIKRNFVFKTHAENKVARLVPDLFLFFKKA